MHAYAGSLKREGKRIGLVPTMGFLHEGHLSLVKKAKEMADIVVVSIFVNPTQFSPNEDFNSYPRDEERDKKFLADMGTDVVFIPNAENIYTEGFQTYIEVTEITRLQEGEFRPTHFKGVTTIVAILFNSVMPDLAVFGQKDAQQVSVIKRMVKDLKYNINIVVAPIVREKDGIAMSSRNVYLSASERKDALVLSRSLQKAKQMVDSGQRDVKKILESMEQEIKSVDSSSLDYIRIVEEESFSEAEALEDAKNYYFLIACRIGKTRLIDNLLINL